MPSTRSLHKVSFRKRQRRFTYRLSWRINGVQVGSIAAPMRGISLLSAPGSDPVCMCVCVAPYFSRRARELRERFHSLRNEMNTLCVPRSRELNFHRSRGNRLRVDVADYASHSRLHAHASYYSSRRWLNARIRWNREPLERLEIASGQRKSFGALLVQTRCHPILQEFLFVS